MSGISEPSHLSPHSQFSRPCCWEDNPRLKLGLLVKSIGDGGCCRLVDNTEDLNASNNVGAQGYETERVRWGGELCVVLVGVYYVRTMIRDSDLDFLSSP